MKKKLLLIFVSLFLVFLTFELFLRANLFSPAKREVSELKTDNKKIILAAGDSFVYGAGVKFGEDYPSFLEELTKEKGYKVINTGLPGQNTSQVYQRLKNDIKTYKPEIVLVQAGYNNYTNFSGLLKKENTPIRFFFLNLRTIRFFKDLLRFGEERKDNFLEKEDWHVHKDKAFSYIDNLPVHEFTVEEAKKIENDFECIIPAYLPDKFSFKSNRFYSSLDYTLKKQNNPGWDFLISMNYEKAIEYFQKDFFLKEDYKGLVMALIKLSRYKDASKYAQKAIEIFTSDKEIEIIWLYASAYNCENKVSQNLLIKKLSDRLENINGDVSTLLVVGDFYKRLGNDLLAMLWYKKAIELNSMSCQPYNRLITYYLDKGQLEEAKIYLRMGKMNNPYNLELKLFQKRYDLLKNLNEKTLKALLDLEEKYHLSYVRKFIIDTLVSVNKSHNEDIIKRLQYMREFDKEYSEKELLMTEAYYYQEINNQILTVDVYEKLFLLTNDILYLKLKADVLFNSNKIDKAIAEFERIKRLLPDEKKYLVFSTLIYLYRKTQDLDNLYRYYPELHKAFPDDTNVWFALLDSLITTGKYDRAKQKVDEFLKDSSHKDDFTKRFLIEKKIDIAIHLADYNEVIKSLKEIISYLDEKQKVSAYTDIAAYYKVMNKYEMAAEFYEKIGDKISLREMNFYLEKGDSLINQWIEDDLIRIYQLCEENNSKLVLINYFEWPIPEMKKVLKENDIIFIDIFSMVKEQVIDSNDYKSLFQRDGHLTKKGNKLTANMIYKEIQRKL